MEKNDKMSVADVSGPEPLDVVASQTWECFNLCCLKNT